MLSKRRGWIAAGAAVLMTTLGAGSAQAAQDLYPQGGGSRDFDRGSGGYTSSTDAEGACVPAVLCPAVTNEHETTGGVRDSGHLRTSIASLTGVGGTSTGTWTSAPFEYRGVAGEEPDRLTLSLARRSDVESFLSGTGNSATYSVSLLDKSGSAIAVIERGTLAGVESYTTKSAGIDPDDVEVGKRYRIEISTRFESGTDVVPGGSVDYDDVALRAKLASRGDDGAAGGGSGQGGPANGSGGPGNGGNGNGGAGNGSGGAGNGFGGTASIAGSVVHQGDRLLVKVRCAKNPRKRCKAQVVARLNKRGPSVTNKRTARVRPGKSRRVALRIKPGYRDEVERLDRIGIRSRTKAGARKAKTKFKVARIKHG